MKTLTIRVREAPAGHDWRVELCFDDGTQDWLQRPAAAGAISSSPEPVALPPQEGGGQLPLTGIVDFLLTHPSSVAYLTIGERFFDLLHGSGIGPVWDRLRAEHEAPRGTGLRTILEFEPQLLRGLPWEMLNEEGRALFLDPVNPFLRALANPGLSVDPHMVPVKILVVVGDPFDPKLAWEEEVDATREGLLSFRGRAEAEFLIGPTPTELVTLHSELQPHIFHFIGHGIRSPTGIGPALLFNSKRGGKKELVGADIRTRLRTGTGRLAILNACRTDQAADSEEAILLNRQTWSVAEAFRGAGYLSVIGMQADIPASASVAFVRTLYQQLGSGNPIDVAVARARMGIGDNRPDVSVDALLLRDWILPSLLLSVAPEHALAMSYGVSGDVLGRIEQTDEFRGIAAFVDRSALRRTVWSDLEADDQVMSRELMVVHGPDEVGKTWLVRHALRTCAWRGRAVNYVSFQDQPKLNMLQVLRFIRDGSSGSFISQGLPAAARQRLTHAVHHLCRGERPPLFMEGQPLEDDQCLTWEPGELIDVVFSSLIEILVSAAGGRPLILALDQLEGVEESALRQLAEHFLRPVARGLVQPVRVIVALRSSQLRERWWPPELLGMAREVNVGEIGDDFEQVAREFVRYWGYDFSKADKVIQAFKTIIGDRPWPPALLQQIKMGLDATKVARRA